MDKLKWILLGYFLRGSNTIPDKTEEPKESKPEDTVSSFRMTTEAICLILYPKSQGIHTGKSLKIATGI